MSQGAPIERYDSVPELGEIWLTPEGVGKFHFIHSVEKVLARVQAGRGLIVTQAADAIQASTFSSDEIIAAGGHDLAAYLKSARQTIPPEYQGALHRETTSYDVTDTGFALMYVKSADILVGLLHDLKQALFHLARGYRNTLMIGRTHGVHAKPITFAFKVLNWFDFVDRAHARLQVAVGQISVGKISGATGIYTQDPEIENEVCQNLGLSPARITTQILPRDIHADFFHAVTCIAVACEYIATEIRNHQRTEIREFEEPFPEGAKGSSAMPHKRNPEKCESICGLARVVRNDMGVIYENITTWHERSLEQSSAERMTHAEMIVLTGHVVKTLTRVIAGLRVYPNRMLENLNSTGGAIYSEEVKTLLLDKGIDPEIVYYAVQEAAQNAFDGEGNIVDNILANHRVGHMLTREELEAVTDPWHVVRFRDQLYARFDL